jgi:hypothetical protein
MSRRRDIPGAFLRASSSAEAGTPRASGDTLGGTTVAHRGVKTLIGVGAT